MKTLQALCILTWFSVCALAEPIPETEVESRARDVGQSLRCVVCQNQSIEESTASLAEDMRILVRARIREGDTNTEVIDFLQNRYGDYVLLKPPVQRNTYVLWFGPFLILGALFVWFFRRTRKPAASITQPETLSPEELSALARLRQDAG
jgi:cytochrome c-type biogenesis protein CcmH